MKSKLKFYLVVYTLLFAVLKFLQYSIYFVTILNVILEEDCIDSCAVNYFEMIFIVCLFLPLSLLIYGAAKVKN